MVVGADERRLRERLRHQDRRRAVAAADVGDARAALELGDDAVERRQPRADEVRVVAGPEEALAAVVDVVHVLVPADAVAAAHRLLDPRRVDHRAERDLEEAGQVRRAVLVGQRDRLLGRERVAPALRVVLDVAARRLRVQPLAHVALGRAGARGQVGGRERAGAGERAVEAELVAHHDERGVQRRADLVDCLEHELLQLLHVERRGGLCDRCHLFPPRFGFGFDRRRGGAGPHRAVLPISARSPTYLLHARDNRSSSGPARHDCAVGSRLPVIAPTGP